MADSQNPLRIAKRWLDEPVGGAKLRSVRAAGAKDGDPTLLATLTIEVNVDRGWERELGPDAAYRAVVRAQDGILVPASVLTAELFGTGVALQLVEWRRGSVVGEFTLHLLSGDRPANLAVGLQSLIALLRQNMSEAIGLPVVDWSEGTWQPGPALAPPPPEPPERGDEKLTKWLLGAAAFVTASLAAIGISNAELVQARLNNATKFGWAFGIVIGATLLAVLWPAWQSRAGVTRFVMAVLTAVVIAVGGGVVWIATMANDSLSHETKPRIDAKITTKGAVTALSGKVTADGITNQRWLTVRVTGVGPGRKPQTAELLSSKGGADHDGKAELGLDVEAGGARFAKLVIEATTAHPERCTDQTNGDDAKCPVFSATPACTAPPAKVACVTLLMRPPATRPRLSATWKTGTSRPVLLIHARATAVADRQRMLLSVRRKVDAKKGGDAPGRLYGATWAPDDAGVIDETLEVPVHKTKASLCVIFRRMLLRPADKTPTTIRDRYGPCGDRLSGVTVLVGPPPV